MVQVLSQARPGGPGRRPSVTCIASDGGIYVVQIIRIHRSVYFVPQDRKLWPDMHMLTELDMRVSGR